jgi:HD-like signal output (HDOD) protein
MDAQEFFSQLVNIPDIPTPQNTVTKINKMLQDYETSIKTLTSFIEKGQVILAKILRVVNSTFYGFRSKTRSIPHPIVVLGFNAVRNVVVSVSIINEGALGTHAPYFRSSHLQQSLAETVHRYCGACRRHCMVYPPWFS